jgi:predicted O-methyltransferase YrrM
MRVTTHFVFWLIGFAQAETQTSEAERSCLARFAQSRKRLVEIGSWHGVSSSCLRRAMAPDGVLICIDPYPVGRFGFSAQRLIALREVSRVRNGRIRWVRKTGADAGHQFAASGEPAVDFVFIDGDHSYDGLREDWEAWSGLVGAGGFIALHDSCSSAARKIDEAGSVIYTRDAIMRDNRFRLVERVDTLSMLERNTL